MPHYTRQTVWTSDKKYCIPAGTHIFPNLNHITNNPEVFPNPRQFMPERFLDSNNNFTKHDHNIVFGIGILIGRSYFFCWETEWNLLQVKETAWESLWPRHNSTCFSLVFYTSSSLNLHWKTWKMCLWSQIMDSLCQLNLSRSLLKRDDSGNSHFWKVFGSNTFVIL